jgi:Na+/phosphate symporter
MTSTINPDEGETAIYALTQDIDKLCIRTLQIHLDTFHIRPQKILQQTPKREEARKENYDISPKEYKNTYNEIKKIQAELINFCIQFETDDINEQAVNKLRGLNKAIINFTQSAKMIKDIKHKAEYLYETDKNMIHEQFGHFKRRITENIANIYLLLLNKENIESNLLQLHKDINTQDNEYLQKI